ncbi:MAG: nucleoside phosphorylase [Bacteroidales bacterium]|nr:nucleoside phosphorylase [Bacteroidales bacterium]
MNNTPIADSELIINPDGSIFHLHIKPGQLANKVILVGDPGRVAMVKSFFDSIECENANREFVSATGSYKGKRITILSTGIGTDNIDIVLTELDALVNIDFATRTPKEEHTSLEIVRIGTSGSLQADLPVDSWLLSEAAIGFDGVLNYYARRNDVADLNFEHAFEEFVDWNPLLAKPYVVNAACQLVDRLRSDARIHIGTTISAPGFYGPQGRVVRLPLASPNLNERITAFRFNGRRVTNYEMECSCIYGLSLLLGHKAATVCAIIANRLAGQYSKDYKPVVKALVEHVLNNI